MALTVAGRLRVSEEMAADLVHAAGRGTVLTLLDRPEDPRDPGLSEAAREAVIAAITTESPALDSPGPVAAAIACAPSCRTPPSSPAVSAACCRNGSTASPDDDQPAVRGG